MATFSMTIQGEPQEFRIALASLLGIEGVDQSAPVDGGNSTPDSALGVPTKPTSPWTQVEIEQLLGQLTKDARPIVEEIASQPGAYAFEELQQQLGMTGLQIAGRLSSVGHAMHNFPGKSLPIQRDYRTRSYSMDPAVAAMIRDAAQGVAGE